MKGHRFATDGVQNRSDLVSYLRLLHTAFGEASDPMWDNDSLESYLEAAAAFADDLPGFYLNRGETMPENPTWKMVADIFAAARMYE